MLPFCLFWYGRKKLKKCNDDEAKLDGLRKAYDDDKISDIVLNVPLEAMEYVSRKAAHGYDNVI